MISTARILNAIITICASIGVYGCYKISGLHAFCYYTVLSNFLALVTSFFYVVLGPTNLILNLRYISTCVLTITMIITIFVLVPTMKNNKALLCGPNFFNHLVVPIVSIISFTFFEEKVCLILLPVIASMIYGSILLYMNYIRRINGPYPFFMIYKQGKKETIIWMIVLPVIIYFISFVISKWRI